jgi:hypothetical protein
LRLAGSKHNHSWNQSTNHVKGVIGNKINSVSLLQNFFQIARRVRGRFFADDELAKDCRNHFEMNAHAVTVSIDSQLRKGHFAKGTIVC